MILCPKCTGHLYRQDQEPSCLICGYADYTYKLPKRKVDTERLRQTLFKFPYVGVMEALKGKDVYFSLNWIPICPFCEKSMDHRGGNSFRCQFRHLIQLVSEDGSWSGWW